ncbi:nuclear transport factor 2 family protein [Paucibacter sp. O1-1]|nr:nuclear transport factor 2 family protein [Paucibacter sp. O1-1]MDA3831427.1 nuclear transport factor 2 family protein [Paucibacter sp. O1-1]
MTAFNQHDSNAMAKFVADDIEWLSIADEQLIAEARGKQNLIDSMNAYFTSCPTCRSVLSDVFSTTNRVSAVEVASWQGQDGLKSQRAISVYEFSEGLINRVYYFPARKIELKIMWMLIKK